MQNKLFREVRVQHHKKIVKIWPNELPFDRNQEEPFVYKVFLLWERTADRARDFGYMYFIGHRSQEPHRRSQKETL